MKRLVNFLSWMVIGGTLGVNHIPCTTFSFWIILVALMVAEHTAGHQ